jgi:preprotein translocase subunit SecA
MKYIITDSKLNKIVIKWLNLEFGDLTPYETEEYPDYIFYMKNKEVVFEYNKKNGLVYISYQKVWSFLENIFGMEYKQIQEVTKLWVEEHYKLGVTTTGFSFSVVLKRWRNVTN